MYICVCVCVYIYSIKLEWSEYLNVLQQNLWDSNGLGSKPDFGIYRMLYSLKDIILIKSAK